MQPTHLLDLLTRLNGHLMWALPRMNTLAEASRDFAEVQTDYQRVLDSVAQRVACALGDVCVIQLLSQDRKSLPPVAAHHPDEQVRHYLHAFFHRPLPAHAGVSGQALREARPILIPEVGSRRHSVLVVPLRARGSIIGTLFVSRAHPAAPLTLDDQCLLEELADRAALAIDNARQFQEAQRAIREREDLIAATSHDLKNPLGIVMLATGLIEQSLPDNPAWAQSRTMINKVRLAGERMEDLIDSLLNLSKLRAGKMNLEPYLADQLILETRQLFQPLAHHRQIHLEIGHLDSGIWITCDPPRLLQVLSNLVGNALKFTPQGGQVTLSLTRDHPWAQFAVWDTGPGIASEQLPRVFDRFWQAQAGEQTGSGLGLAIAKGVVEAHGGTITVESRVGQGSSFAFRLPLKS